MTALFAVLALETCVRNKANTTANVVPIALKGGNVLISQLKRALLAPLPPRQFTPRYLAVLASNVLQSGEHAGVKGTMGLLVAKLGCNVIESTGGTVSV